MKTQDITIKCGRCNGTGIEDNTRDEQGNPIPESCTSCGGDGYIESGLLDVTEVMNELSDIKDKVNDIKEKVDEIKEELDE